MPDETTPEPIEATSAPPDEPQTASEYDTLRADLNDLEAVINTIRVELATLAENSAAMLSDIQSRIAIIEGTYNERTNGSDNPGNDSAQTGEGPTEEEPRIAPNREHPYFKRLW